MKSVDGAVRRVFNVEVNEEDVIKIKEDLEAPPTTANRGAALDLWRYELGTLVIGEIIKLMEKQKE